MGAGNFRRRLVHYLVDISDAIQLRPMIADIANFQGKVTGESVLNIDIPTCDERCPEIAVHGEDIAGRGRRTSERGTGEDGSGTAPVETSAWNILDAGLDCSTTRRDSAGSSGNDINPDRARIVIEIELPQEDIEMRDFVSYPAAGPDHGSSGSRGVPRQTDAGSEVVVVPFI